MISVDKMMREGIARGVFAGGVLQVAVGGETVFKSAYGAADLFCGQAMTVDTCFDLASLTKPLAAVPAVMLLVQRGALGLDQTLGEILPEATMGGDKAAITMRQLLNHSSGLPPWRPFFMRLRGVASERRLDALRRLVLDEPLVSPPGRLSDYSDLGYMLLQWVVERISARGLDRFAAEEIYLPLGIAPLFFNDVRRPEARDYAFAATQLCPWRCRLMKGQVDDDNAYVVGGVGGHAGLFGTADAVCRLLNTLLSADHGDGVATLFTPDVVRTFFASRPQERWALGFDTPSPQGSSAGRFFPDDSVGHLGFTGTSFWVHRARRIVVVLLTNRVHPFRFNTGIKAFRPALHDAVMTSLV